MTGAGAELQFAAPSALWLLAAVALAGALLVVLDLRGREARALVDRHARSSGRAARSAVLLAALALVAVALARPVIRGEGSASGAAPVDVVVALDVSTSMLAEDVAPSRFERGRAVLLDLLERLEGHRVSLVAFAGSSGILLPLTADLGAARLYAEQVQVQSVDEPGTSLGRAVTRAVELFESGGQGERVLIVISDGEDLGGDPLGAATAAASQARDADVVVVGVVAGTDAGATIPLDVMGTETIKRGPNGAPVVTRARPDALAVLAAGGLTVDAASADAAAAIAELVASRASPARQVGGDDRELFQIPLLAALALLAAEYAVISLRR